ncbi:MAG TPA: gephyrin-like molybdotransferase Glp [Patescibacteria group bacterium]|nr:gephyrin-like molybdotransferase Glp [Patescibacteria group bacterium]
MAPTPFDQAVQFLRDEAAARLLPPERITLAQARGRVLAEDVIAPISVPGFANAAMDGYALRTDARGASAGACFRVIDLALAGAATQRIDDAATCVEIATGAALPAGADCVVPYESTTRAGDIVQLRSDIAVAANLRGAEDDYARGQRALHRGRVLDAGALGVLAGLGLGDVVVRRRPSVAVIVTGSELQPAGATLARGQIHDSNSTTLRALLRAQAESLTMIGPVRDERESLASVMREAARVHDVLVTAGGASAGRADFIPGLVRELGEIRLWKVATRPGMPFLYGRIGDCSVYGLPGNPVSVFASMLTLVFPALHAMQGRAPSTPQYACLAEAVRKPHARLEWRRGVIDSRPDGRRVIAPHAAQGSGMLRSVAESNALFRIDADTRGLGAGQIVQVLPFPA